MNVDLLHHIYHFPGLDLPSAQDATVCTNLAACFVSFAENMVKGEKIEQEPKSKYPTSAFEDVVDKLKLNVGSTNGIPTVCWFPEYGCAVIFHTARDQWSNKASIHVIGLDEHENEIHPGKKKYQYSSIAKSFQILAVGEICIEEKDKFFSRFQYLLAARNKKDEDRSAAGGKQGHQRTPAFIHAILKQTLFCACLSLKECTCTDILPKGGFTDVGLHTGGEKRDTCYALVRSVFHWFLDDALHFSDDVSTNDTSFDVVLLHFEMFLAGNALSSMNSIYESIGSCPSQSRVEHRIDYFHFMLKKIATSAAQLSDKGYSLTSFYERIKIYQQTIKAIFFKWDEINLEKYRIKKHDSRYKSPHISIPDYVPSKKMGHLSKEELDNLIEENLGSLVLISNKNDLQEAAAWAKEQKDKAKLQLSKTFVFLHEIEHTFWAMSERHLEHDPLHHDDLGHVMNLVDYYREVVQEFSTKKCLSRYDLLNRICSVELVLVWLAYCIVFNTNLHFHQDAMNSFGVALDYKDLKYLVLHDSTHIKIMEKVATFLHRNRKRAMDVFSMKEDQSWDSPTFQLGEKYAEKYLYSTWENEEKDAKYRVDKHWAEVERKQNLAIRLRQELRRLQEEYDDAQNHVSYVKSRLRIGMSSYQERNTAEEKETSAHSKVISKQRELQNAEKAPSPIIQPLPKNKTKAMKVLFFLYMPIEFQYLSRITLTAQQLLVPRPWIGKYNGADGVDQGDIFQSIVVSDDVLSWTDHYNDNQSCTHHNPLYKRKGNQQCLDLSMHYKVPEPRHIGPNHVDSLKNRTQGVWYPDESNVRMLWGGGSHSWDKHGSGKKFNPFKVSSNITASYFTEKLNPESSDLQWSLNVQSRQKCPEKQHGNRPYAPQDSRPIWLTKEGFLDFTMMRRFPHLALRKFCVALKHGSLPLEHHAVHTLLQQTLFQIGDLSVTNGVVQMKWRTDIEDIHYSCRHLFENLAKIYCERPHDYKVCMLLGQLSCYFSFLEVVSTSAKSCNVPSYKLISRTLAQSAMNWGNDLSSDKMKRIIFYRTAVMCLTRGIVDKEDVGIILPCILQAKNIFVQVDNSEEMDLLKELCEYNLSHCLESYIKIIVENQEILSAGLTSVIRSAPNNLHWEREEGSQVSFSATGQDAHRYSVNTLTGIVLVDGLPPSQLPLNITKDALYKKIFCGANFEVVLKDGFETVNPINGFYYRFHKVESSLVIQESLDTSKDVVDCWSDPLELLDISKVETNMPFKLKQAYSHWFSRKHSALVFRPFNFRKRDIYYIHHLGHCKNIPRHINSDQVSWMETTKHPDIEKFVVIHDSQFVDILERFELREMMVTYHEKSCDMYSINFHRFGLTFSYDLESLDMSCNEISGYHLRKKQHLSGMLHGLHQSLILDSNDKSRTKIIIPFGEIITTTTSGIRINLLNINDSKIQPSNIKEANSEEEMKFFIYDVHPRFGTLIGSNLSSRIYLAGLYMATTLFVPDTEYTMTGEEKAIELLRQCWVNRPLTSEETYCLENVKCLSKCRSPCLYLLCIDIGQSSTKYGFLHGKDCEIVQNRTLLSEFSDEGTAYQARLNHLMNPRLLLRRSECNRCLGNFSGTEKKTSVRPISQYIDINLNPTERCMIDTIQQCLNSLWTRSETDSDNESFPIHTKNDTFLETAVYGELKESWKLHCEERKSIITLKDTNVLYKLKEDVTYLLKRIEVEIMEILNSFHLLEREHWHTQALQLLRVVNILPTANKVDIASLACQPNKARLFNPLLSLNALKTVKNSAILWLELCVLEDKLSFLLSFKDTNLSQNEAFVNELISNRKWDPHQHPYWLVFEVEQGIRIRPEQYEVAKHLTENDGEAVQLNMGLGKTRVILPMLILFWSYTNVDRRIPRLSILSTLLNEACEYFQNVLTASVLGRKLFTLPFQRDIELDNNKLMALQDLTNYCWQEQGYLVVAPEHRLSLELKVKELCLAGQSQQSLGLDKALSKHRWCDIIDEVDEVLHHRFQLVYSMGDPQPLSQVQYRWKSIQALLKVIRCMEFKGITLTTDAHKPEAYPLVTVDENIDISAFRICLVKLLLKSPPLEVRWLQGHKKSDIISHVLTSPEADPNVLKNISEEHLYYILSLRGLLAYDILLHCLKKRHRVNYGVNECGKKRLSVPFRGADTPSKRAEFSHPDCAMMLTILAYYERGLGKKQIETTFQILLRKGRNSRSSIYDEWIKLSEGRMTKEMAQSVSHVDKIDLTNSKQVDVLFNFFHRNPSTIEFWLNSCVFPNEVDQYTKRMVANSWHLAQNDNGHVIGFSGTNDNHLILPLQVKQHLPWDTTNKIWKGLLSTNGRMLDMLIEKTISCEKLGKGKAHDTLLTYIKLGFESSRHHFDALIDGGALLAGYSNFEVAQSIVRDCIPKSNRLKGVTFFDENKDPNGSWMILDTFGRCLPKDQSPLSEKDTFALFDEPRCRGVDLKLQPDAIAVLTLGKNMCKDKFMQAAGRMRQLKTHQRIIVVGEEKIFHDIERLCTNVKRKTLSISNFAMNTCTIDIKNVLSWIMHNTIESIWKGLDIWSKQGIFHAAETKPNHALLDEVSDLNAFYGKPIHETSILEQAKATKYFHCNRTEGGNDTLMSEIIKRCKKMGDGYTIMKIGADEECERELQRETEEEEEEERETPKMIARNESDWDYSTIFAIDSLEKTKLPVTVFTLREAMSRYISCKDLRGIGWSQKVFCTENFFITIEKNETIDNFLRIPDCFIRFPGGGILLLSEREATEILQLFWSKRKNSLNGYYFGHCAFENEELNGSPQLRYSNDLMNTTFHLPDQDVCTFNLFNGECKYPGSQRHILKDMLSRVSVSITSSSFSVSKTTGEPIHLVNARGKNADFDRSDLEQICEELACEVEEK